VYRVALRLTGNEAEAEDVVQETFLSAFKAIDKFEGRSGLATWLYRIAHNAALMRLRRVKPDQVSVDDEEVFGEGLPVPTQMHDWCCLPERDFESSETRAELERAIKDLPEKLRVVFVMRELEGLSTEETAQALDISIDAAKVRLRQRHGRWGVDRQAALDAQAADFPEQLAHLVFAQAASSHVFPSLENANHPLQSPHVRRTRVRRRRAKRAVAASRRRPGVRCAT